MSGSEGYENFEAVGRDTGNGSFEPVGAKRTGDGSHDMKVVRPWELYKPAERRNLLLVLFLTGTCNYADRNVIGVLLEPIKAEFGATDTELGLLSGFAFALFYATVGLPLAMLADRGDRRRIITWSVAVWSAMTVLCGMAQSLWQLALARIGVGAGEAGAIPPAQSLIADYYPPHQRASALGLYMMSSMAGYVLGLIGGGWIAQYYGWRMAFIALGLPGFFLAVVGRFVLSEPRRHVVFSGTVREPTSLRKAVQALFAKTSYRNVATALVFYHVVAFGSLVFVPSFIIRVHALSVAEAGALFGVTSAVGAVIGNIAGGRLADALAQRDIAWMARLPAIGLIVAMPLYIAAFLVTDILAMASILLVAGTVLVGAVPPMFGAVHAVCGSARRAIAVALLFFFGNLIGLSIGPLITGAISDYLSQSFGPADGLRYALIVATLTFIPCSVFMFRAAGHLERDIES